MNNYISNNEYFQSWLERPRTYSDPEFIVKLNEFVFHNTFSEKKLIEALKRIGVDLGKSPKTRLNYLIVLKAIPPSKPVFFGKGKGGLRFFHKDTLEILTFLESLREKASISESVKMLEEERIDRVRLALKKCNYINFDRPFENIPLHKWCGNIIVFRRFFNSDTIKGHLISIAIIFLTDLIYSLKMEIEYFNDFLRDVKDIFCNSCMKYVLEMTNDRNKLLDKYENDLAEIYQEAKNLIKIET